MLMWIAGIVVLLFKIGIILAVVLVLDLTSLAVEDYPVHAKIQYPKVEERKMAASACHASQGGGRLIRGPMAWILRLFAGKATDTFMQAYPEPDDGKISADLFEGI